MAKRDDHKVTEQHFECLPNLIAAMKPTDMNLFAWQIGNLPGFCENTILAIWRMGYISRGDTGIYTWNVT